MPGQAGSGRPIKPYRKGPALNFADVMRGDGWTRYNQADAHAEHAHLSGNRAPAMSKSLHTEPPEDELLFLFEAIAQHPACAEFVENSNRDLADVYDSDWLRRSFVEYDESRPPQARKLTNADGID